VSERVTRKRFTPDRPARGRADLAWLRSASDAEVARTVPAEYANLPDDFWEHGTVVFPEKKHPISLRVDVDVLQWFRQAGPRYQSRMNAVLRSYVARMKDRRPVTKAAKARRKGAA